MTQYTAEFYENLKDTSRQSAAAILPLLFDLYQPKSMVDVGCAEGAWLATAQSLGVETVLGVDGPWVDQSKLQIPAERFVEHNLQAALPVTETFDLAMSLEVAEHLPPTQAADFVKSLTRLAPVVLFSAAVEKQGGTMHLNEQWPAYWAALFRQEGYVPVDALRFQVWDNPDVSWWYKQNMILYVKETALENLPKLKALAEQTHVAHMKSLIHPQLLNHYHKMAHPGFGRWLRQGGRALGRSLRKITGKR